MRWRPRRLISSLCILISLIILYRSSSSTKKQPQTQSPFQIIHSRNATYRILSSSFRYEPLGMYLNFAYFNVEQRQRVLHIDYLHGVDRDVPVSSQWKSTGHLYPIQIAQFGLSHWSRLKSNSKTKSNHIYRFERIQIGQAIAFDGKNACSSAYTIDTPLLLSNSFIHFTIPSNSSLHFHFLHNDIELIYSTMSIPREKTANQIWIPLQGSPRVVNRHMLIDIVKSGKLPPIFKTDTFRIYLCGQTNSVVHQLIIGNETLYNEQAFHAATRWLINHQDLKTGCWFIYIARKFGKHQLRMPWCSAMAQGQVTSLLVRLYSQTKTSEDLSIIRRAIQPLWASNITRAYFNNQYLWLEEYPLNSSSKGLFVLNGCLYALIGVIDAWTIDPQSYLSELIDQILHSLEHMLPYYLHPQISNWSLYDLSHLTMKTKPNTASYSYHLVHITLLQCLSQIFEKTNSTISKFFHWYAQRFQLAIR